MTDMDEPAAACTRRSVLEATLGVAGILALVGWPGVRAAAVDARGSTTLGQLNPDEAATLDALVGHIIPTDDTPGAREMGVVRFIDRALRGFLAPIATEFRAGLAEFESNCRQGHPDQQGFASLPSDQQVEWMQRVEHTSFFEQVQQLTVLGALTMPDYGGNKNGLGWKLIGFEDLHAFQPPFGHYDRDYPGFVTPGSPT